MIQNKVFITLNPHIKPTTKFIAVPKAMAKVNIQVFYDRDIIFFQLQCELFYLVNKLNIHSVLCHNNVD